MGKEGYEQRETVTKRNQNSYKVCRDTANHYQKNYQFSTYRRHNVQQ